VISFFVCASNISGTAEWICAKFTGRTCLALAWTSLNVKVKGQRHQGQKTRCPVPSLPPTTEWNALAANNVTQRQTAPFRRCRGVITLALVIRLHFYSATHLFTIHLSWHWIANNDALMRR